MMEAICSFDTSALTRAIWHHILEDGILHKIMWYKKYGNVFEKERGLG
jgi:hypothetical protein